ncbi:MAG: hypothetical protein LVR00_04925 [Rhabdochlamydiaceae bacterium]|jgi:hypothetical protein
MIETLNRNYFSLMPTLKNTADCLSILTINQLILNIFQNYANKINEKTKKERVTNVRRTMDVVSTAITVIYFFKSPYKSLLNFIKEQPVSVVITILNCMARHSYFVNRIQKLEISNFLWIRLKICEYVLTPFLKIRTPFELAEEGSFLKKTYNIAILSPILEESYFRAISEFFYDNYHPYC